MKLLSRIIDILIVCVVLILLASFLGILPLTRSSDKIDYGESYAVTSDPDSAFFNNLSDTLPYKVYRHLYDSARNADNSIRWANDESGAAWFFGGIALTTSNDCNNCTTPEQSWDNNIPKTKSYYIGIGKFDFAYRLVAQPVFFRKNGKDYLKYYDSVKIKKVNTLVPTVKEVPFRYDKWSKTILFPLTKGGFIAVAVLYGIFALTLTIAFLLILSNIFKLCVSIARGVFFTRENKQRLAVAAYSICVCWMLPVLVYWAIRLCNYQLINNWFIVSPDDSGNSIVWLIIAVFFWHLSKAFNKGLQLQQEHDLTV